MTLKMTKRLTMTGAAILGAYLLGHGVVNGSCPITLAEYKMDMTEEEAANVTESDLLVDGEPLLIATRTHVFSLLWMAIGASVAGGITWCVFVPIERRKNRLLQQSPPPYSSPVAGSESGEA
jgi:hypothetical protein